jgi:ferredoxin
VPEIIAHNIDRLTCVEMRSPGIDRGIIEPLYRAAREAQGGVPLSLRAARLIQERVQPKDTAVIITGAGAPPYLPYGETDGPPGAVALARAIGRGFGARIVLVTEPRYRPGVEAAARAGGLPVVDDALAAQRPGAVVVRSYPVEDDAGRREAEAILTQYTPSIVIAVEKDPKTRLMTISQFDIDIAKCMYCGLCSEPCPTGSIHHTTEFEGADFSLESLIRRFIKEPVAAYKPKKGPETDPRIVPILNRGMRYVDEWAQPGGEKPAEEPE